MYNVQNKKVCGIKNSDLFVMYAGVDADALEMVQKKEPWGI